MKSYDEKVCNQVKPRQSEIEPKVLDILLPCLVE